MSNQEEKKCEFCGGTGMIYKQNMDSEGKVTSYGYKCDCQFPKPSPSQSCEHDDGDVWINQMFAHHKKHHKTCPFCKPTAVEPLGNPDIGYGVVTLCSNPHKAVEPSWESIDRKEAEKIDRAILDALPVEPSVEEIAEKITAEAFYKGLKLQMEPWLREKITEALRNERNRK